MTQPILVKVSQAATLQEVSFHCFRGDTFELSFNFTDENGNVLDISDWDIVFTAKLFPDSEDDDEGVIAEPISIVSGEDGTAKLVIASDKTDVTGAYFFDCQYKDQNSKVKTFMSGSIVFTRDVSRREESE